MSSKKRPAGKSTVNSEKIKSRSPVKAVIPYICAIIGLFILCFTGPDTVKAITVAAVPVAVIAAVITHRSFVDKLRLPFICLAAIVLMDGISTFYAASPKFAYYEFLKVLFSFSVSVILLAFSHKDSELSARRIASLLSRITALAGLISIDMISTRFISNAFFAVLELFSDDYTLLSGIEAGVRITSLFDSPNVFAGCVGIGTLLSLSLALSSDKKAERFSHLVSLFINAFSFVLAFSMGASAFIGLAFLVYLAFEYKERRASLFILMAETLIIVIIPVALVSKTSFDAWESPRFIPLLCVIIGSAVLCLADFYIGKKLSDKLSAHSRSLLIVIAAAVLFIAAFSAAAVNITGGISLTAGASLRRASYPDAGEYTLTADYDGDAKIKIESQNRYETMMHTSTVIYSGKLSDVSFTVPEDSTVVFFTITASSDTHIEALRYSGLSGTSDVPLRYKLLPGFIANRLQGLWANQNAIQRLVFFSDGIKLFKLSPIIGRGMGGYENGIQSVQSFSYQTKYAHNHYVQLLCETGIIGFVLFISLLLVSAICVIRARKMKKGSFTPVLAAALVFMAGHAAVEVVFSYHAYLPLSFMIFTVINISCGDMLPLLEIKPAVKKSIAGAYALLAVIYFILICCNIYAVKLVENDSSFAATEKAIALDRFQWPDHAATYVLSAPYAADSPEVTAKAEAYAERLSKLDSNILPYYLAYYYFTFSQQDKGFEMIEKYVNYVSSSSETWQNAFSLLENFYDGSDSFRSGVSAVYELFTGWDSENIGSLTLTEDNSAFLSSLGIS